MQLQCVLLKHKNMLENCYLIPPPTILAIILYVTTHAPEEIMGMLQVRERNFVV